MKKVLLWVALGLLILGGGITEYKARAAAAAESTQYKVATVAFKTVRSVVTATGTLQPWTEADIKSKAGGRINELLVDAGAVVKKNQVLARIDPTDALLPYNQARASVAGDTSKKMQNTATYKLQLLQTPISIDQAEANLAAAEAVAKSNAALLKTAQDQADAQPALTRSSILTAQANYEALVQERVQLTSTQAQDRANYQSAYDQAVANLTTNANQLARDKELYSEGYIAPQTVDQAQAACDVSKAQVASAK